MSKSIIQTGRYCYLCDMNGIFNEYQTQEHHCLSGVNRKLAEHYGLKVYLCYEHHEGTYGVHGMKGIENKRLLQEIAQDAFMKRHGTKEDFIRIFGKAYK